MNDVRIHPASKPEETHDRSDKIAIVPDAEVMDGYAGFPQPADKPTLLGKRADFVAKALAVGSQEELDELLLCAARPQSLNNV